MAMAASLPLLPPFSSSSSSSTGCLQVKGHRNRASIVSFLGSRDSTECNPSFSSSHGLTTTASPQLRHSLSSSSTIFHIHPLRSHEQRVETRIQAAWTRRSSNQPKKTKKSWGQRVDKYMRPFMLDINVSRRYISAKVMHRVTSKVVSVVSTNSKDLRDSLPILNDSNACRVVGKLLAERAKASDVFAVTYEPRKNEKLEGKLALILDTILENEITLV